jgi:hypothetical protein
MNRGRYALLCSLLAAFSLATESKAASMTAYPTEADFLSAIDPALLQVSENFEGFAVGTIVTTQIGGVAFSSPNASNPAFVPIQVADLPGAVSPPHVLAGGTVASKTVRQQIVMDFPIPASALAFYVVAQSPVLRQIAVRFDFIDGTFLVRSVEDVDARNRPAEFFGVTADTPFFRVTITSNEQSGGVFQEFGGLDNLHFAVTDTQPPLCSGEPVQVAGQIGVNGIGRDDRPGDSGIAVVALGAGSTNLALAVAPFTPGAPVATFRVEPTDNGLEAQGTVLVSDGAGNSCSLCLNFKNLPPGPTFAEILCCAEGINFQVNNPALTPPGPSFCSTSPFGPDQPALPPGYEPSSAVDPFPCAVFTIDSPIAGLTEMILKKDGAFDPRLRMLYSHFDGTGFPSFSDVTESVIPILDVVPDPTRLSGKVQWSKVKVACAVRAETCNGVDDDGDGLVDEGLPVGDFSVDQDLDGFFLCAPAAAQADCNDEIASINPAASETCNGLDDDCDGVVDDGNPGGGVECAVDGRLGVCASGLTECFEGAVGCTQTVFPSAELCDGLDNDCDGIVPAGEADADGDGFRGCAGDCDDTNPAIYPGAAESCDGNDNNCDGNADEGNPGGGAACGTTAVGACELGVTACSGGALVCVGNVEPAPEICGDGIDNDCDGVTDEGIRPVAVCAISPTNLNVQSTSSSFQISLSSLTDTCSASAPVALDPSRITTAYISRAGGQALPNPASLACPDPQDGFLGERGIFENLGSRQRTGNDLNLKFNHAADGDCRTADGDRQDLFALVSDALDGSIVPICMSSTIDGVAFECCTSAKVTNTGNR